MNRLEDAEPGELPPRPPHRKHRVIISNACFMISTRSSSQEVATAMVAHGLSFRRMTPTRIELWAGNMRLSPKLRQSATDTGDYLDDCVAAWVAINQQN